MSELLPHISYSKAYRVNRLAAAEWVLAHPETIEELIHYCFHEPQPLATKATWVFEFVCRKDLSMIYPHLDYIFEHLDQIKAEGALRSMALMCELITLSYYKHQDKRLRELFMATHKDCMIEQCFEWLITDRKVACQVHAMTALYYLGTETDWVHGELQQILHRNIHKGSPGYQARARKVLKQIESFKK